MGGGGTLGILSRQEEGQPYHSLPHIWIEQTQMGLDSGQDGQDLDKTDRIRTGSGHIQHPSAHSFFFFFALYQDPNAGFSHHSNPELVRNV